MAGLTPGLLISTDRARPYGLALYVDELFLAVALPPFRPPAFFCAVVPPRLELPPEPDFFPLRLEAPGELAIRAARPLDMPLSLRASYCRSFLTLGRLSGMSFLLVRARASARLGVRWRFADVGQRGARVPFHRQIPQGDDADRSIAIDHGQPSDGTITHQSHGLFHWSVR